MAIFLILFFLFNNITVTSKVAHANEVEPCFARIVADDVFFYREPNENDSKSIYFILPKTYFVKLLSNYDENFYLAEYKQFSGYVKKNEVKAVAETPNSPYFEDTNFRVYAELSRDLRSEPSSISGSSITLANIPLLCNDLTFYGAIHGESKISGRTDVWYYCKFVAEQEYYGYVYSDFCDEFDISQIPLNTENLTFISNPTFEKLEKVPTTLPSKNKNIPIIILILTFPALIFIYLIIKNSRLFSSQNKQGEIQDY